MRRIRIDTLEVAGEELGADRLAQVAGGLYKADPGPAPTRDVVDGHLDPPGSISAPGHDEPW